MKKLSLEEFRKYKKEVNEIFQEVQKIANSEKNDKDNEIFQKLNKMVNSGKCNKECIEKIIERYRKVIEILSGYDLSDIDFNEWKDMILAADNELGLEFDFSKTNANLDFSIINIKYLCGKFNFKGCKIKNFDLSNISKYYPEMFEPEFLKECIRNYAKCGFDEEKEHITKSIMSTTLKDDVEFIKECMRKCQEYGFNGYSIHEFIYSTNLRYDLDFMRECVENYTEYEFTTYRIVELLEATDLIKDIEFIKDCIRNHENVNDKIRMYKKWNLVVYKIVHN